jgi:hypothetical protein
MRRSQRPRQLSTRLDPAAYLVGARLPSQQQPTADADEDAGAHLAALLEGTEYAYAPNPALAGSLVTTPLRPRAPGGHEPLVLPASATKARAASVEAARALLHALGRRSAASPGK